MTDREVATAIWMAQGAVVGSFRNRKVRAGTITNPPPIPRKPGERELFEQLMPGLKDYLLYPYLQYEDLRFHRGRVDDQEMVAFLDGHGDWAFTEGLRTAWLKSLGKRKHWDSLLKYAPGSGDTEVRCYLAHARLLRGQTEGLLTVAQQLWTVGKSQPDACDPVFKWLRKQGGITPGLAWERIRLAMEAREPRLALYLARFLPAGERAWVDRWYQQNRAAYWPKTATTTFAPGSSSKILTLIGAFYSQHFEKKAIAACKTTNEYFLYLFGSWDCSRTKLTRNGQMQLQHMYATGPRRLYFTKSFRSTGRSFRPSWQVMARPCQHTLQKNLTST